MSSRKYLLAIFFISITFVGVIAGAQLARIEDRQRSVVAVPIDIPLNTDFEPVITDSAFLEPITKDQFQPIATTSRQISKAAIDPVLAESYIVGDILTGKIYMEKNSTQVYPFASMSKLITALVAEDNYRGDKLIAITQENTRVSPDASALRAGETFTLNELMYPLLLNSSNVAGEAIASSSDRMKFLELMSSYSWEIGMPKAFFVDPTGLSERNAGTAKGFFAMARYLYSQKPEILAITKLERLSVGTTTNHGAHDFVNIHPFVRDARFLGGKTGRTPAALDTMLTILNIWGRPVAIVVMRSPGNRAKDTAYLAQKVSNMLAL